MFKYCEDIRGWEEWQRDYRLGLILIFPPPEIADKINPLRRRYDPRAFAICPAHITVSDPLQKEMTPELDTEIQSILERIPPFRLFFSAPAASHDYAGVAYPIYPEEPIETLQEQLHQGEIFDGKIYHRREIPPHMTVAEFVTIEESWQILGEIKSDAPRGSFLCDRLALIIPDQEFHFQKAKDYYLKGEGVK